MDRFIRIAIAATFTATAISCGSSPPPAQPREDTAEEPQEVALTFSSTGCSLTDSGQVTPGPVAFALTNETAGEARMHVWGIDDDFGYADFSAHIDEEAARIAAGEEPIGGPDYATFVVEVIAAANGSTAEEATVAEGVYAFACFPGEGNEHEAIYSAGPLEVTG